MKTWKRITLVSFILVGGTAFFAYQLLNQFNNALDDLSTSTFEIAKIPPTSSSGKKIEDPIPTSTPETLSTSTLEITSTSTPETLSTSTLQVASTSTPEIVSTSTLVTTTGL